jgi:hypothetical protein
MEEKIDRKQIVQLLKTIGRRKQHKSQRCTSNLWPSQSSVTLLNGTYSRPVTAKKDNDDRKTCETEEHELPTKSQWLRTVSVMSFSRPMTCGDRPRYSRAKKNSSSKSIDLFQTVQREKIGRL